jgi:hypothetical protein
MLSINISRVCLCDFEVGGTRPLEKTRRHAVERLRWRDDLSKPVSQRARAQAQQDSSKLRNASAITRTRKDAETAPLENPNQFRAPIDVCMRTHRTEPRLTFLASEPPLHTSRHDNQMLSITTGISRSHLSYSKRKGRGTMQTRQKQPINRQRWKTHSISPHFNLALTTLSRD